MTEHQEAPKPKILIVEDEAIIALDLKSKLEQMGYTVLAHLNSAEKALELLEQTPPDLVLMDIILKGKMDGIEAADIIRSRWGIPVIFCTAYADQERLKRAKLVYPFGYILKPFQDNELKVTVEMALYVSRVDRERRKAEEALQKSEEKYKALIETTDTGYLILDSEGKVVDANSEYVRLSGHATLNEIVGRSVLDWTAGHDLARNRAEVIKCLERGFIRGLEIDYIDREGRITPVEIHATVVRKGASLQIISLCRDISGRKQTDYALRLSEEKLSKAFQASPDWISISTLDDGRYLDVNESYLRLTGYTRNEVVGHTSTEINLWNNPDDRKKGLEIIREKGALKDFEVEFRMKSGEIKLILWSAEVIELEGQKCIISVCHDITDRKQAEEALHSREKRFRAIFDRSFQYAFILDTNGNLLEINELGYTIIGVMAETSVGKPFWEAAWRNQFPEDQEKTKLAIQNCQMGQSVQDEVMFIDKDFRTHHGIRNFTPITDENGKLLFISVVGLDVSSRKQAEEALNMSLDKLRKAMGATVQALAITAETRDPYTAGHQKRVANLSRTMAQNIGLPIEKVDGLRLAAAIHDLGKISVPAEILSKPTKLTDLEFGLIRIHPRAGYEVLKDIEFPWPIARMVLEHHERMNGSGYPNGLTGDQLLLETKILIVADVVEAIASHRPYRPGFGIETALEEIEKNKSILYDPEVVDVCLRLFREKGYSLD